MTLRQIRLIIPAQLEVGQAPDTAAALTEKIAQTENPSDYIVELSEQSDEMDVSSLALQLAESCRKTLEAAGQAVQFGPWMTAVLSPGPTGGTQV